MTPEALVGQVLPIIRSIPNQKLGSEMAFLVGGSDVQRLVASWDKLEEHFAAAKLAIVRDEFSVRFPLLSEQTEGFTFGLLNPAANRYMDFLKPRETSDITNLVMQLLDDVYPPTIGFWGKQKRISSYMTLGLKIIKALTAYSQHIEATLHPFAEAFGVRAD
ncbi:hypothetical protein [Massilia sp. X63]|uniref:hypothetical protein n=1 Tax=Massilia sp. X63 TaxID=3237285 RepID=UPI0034DCF2CE